MLRAGSELRGQPAGPGHGVRRFERRQDALEAGERAERVERVGVGRADVLGAAEVPQPRVLGPHGRVVEPGRNRVRARDVAVVVLQDRRVRALEDPR